MKAFETLINAIAQNFLAIISIISSLASACLGSYLTIYTHKSERKSEIKTANYKEKMAAYIDLLAALQEIRYLATEYASCNYFPNGEHNEEAYGCVLSRYCELTGNLKKASIKTFVYAPQKLALKISDFSDKIYEDFISYMKYGTTQLSNDTGNDGSKLQTILDEINNLENMIRCDIQKGAKL